MQIPQFDEQACFMINAASKKIASCYREILDPLGITYPQYLVLVCLWRQDGLSLDQIGEQLHLDSGTLTPLIKRLESKGMLTRKRNPLDERCLIIELTEESKAMQRHVPSILENVITSLNMTEQELSVFLNSLHKIVNNIDEIKKKDQKNEK